jgi:NhaC family Na+:H+ antiporter
MAEKTSPTQTGSSIKSPSMLDALIPVFTLVVLLIGAVSLFGADAPLGPVQIGLIFSTLVAMAVGLRLGYKWEDMGRAAVEGISGAMGAIFILLAVGALIGTWSMAGTVVTMVSFGVSFLNPAWYYVACVVICAVVALSIGSSWTVAATLGVSLVAISGVIGVSPAIAAGAVISGSYFGDKLSPLSETTNLAAAVAGIDIFTHIKNMLWSTIPSIIIALFIFAGISILGAPPQAELDVTVVLDVLDSIFNVSIWTLIPLVAVLVMALMRVPPFVTIMTGALLGGIFAVILQPDIVLSFVDDPTLSTPVAMLKGVWTVMATGFALDTDFPALTDLVSRGGMSSMLETVWLIISAMAFGGVMEYTGLLARLLQPLLEKSQGAKSLLLSVSATALGLNVIAGDQYMAIVLPGKMFAAEFQQEGIAPETLSRQIEDTATITSPLVPWNSCGAYMAATLGIPTFSYLPYSFFNLINPLVSVGYTLTGFKIKRIDPADYPVETPQEGAFYNVGGQRLEPTTLAEEVRETEREHTLE